MFSAMLLVISIVALSQFAIYYWRAVVAGVAAQPVSDRVLEAARVEQGHLKGQDFETLSGLHELTPALMRGYNGLFGVRLYYRFTALLSSFVGRHLPAISAWTERERVICARYAAVQIDRRLQANLALAASLRSS